MSHAVQYLLEEFSDGIVDELAVQHPMSRVRPIRRRPYRLPTTLQAELTKTIDLCLHAASLSAITKSFGKVP